MEKDYINIVITNCAYHRGGSKAPFRIRKFQNHHTVISKEDWENLTEKQLLNKCNGSRYKNGHIIYILNSSRIKKL